MRDIAGGKVRVFCIGYYSDTPVGVPRSLWYLFSYAEVVPIASGCVLDGKVKTDDQARYAIEYNRTIARHLLRLQALAPEVLEQELLKEGMK